MALEWLKDEQDSKATGKNTYNVKADTESNIVRATGKNCFGIEYITPDKIKHDSIDNKHKYQNFRNTFGVLHMMPGAERAKSNTPQYFIEWSVYKNELVVNCYIGIDAKPNRLTPPFSSRQAAHNAIGFVGKSNLIDMFKYLRIG